MNMPVHSAIYRLTIMGLVLTGCQTPSKLSPLDQIRQVNDAHVRRFGDFQLPRKIGTIENVGLQLPALSPDGHQILYLRTGQNAISPMTLLGSRTEPPTEGTLSIWLRPAQGSSIGRQISPERWAHSPVWAATGKAFAYVAEAPAGTMIVHCTLATGRCTELGKPGAINCLPRFEADDRTLLFCSTDKPTGPFRVFRQTINQSMPEPLTPEGAEVFLPLCTENKAAVICAVADGDKLVWTLTDLAASRKLCTPFGQSARPAVLQTWAGIGEPLSPNRTAFLFYDSIHNRIAVHHLSERLTRNHRSDSIAACWLDDDTIALATGDRVFTVSIQTGMSLEMFNGQWIPCRYVPSRHALVLLGRETDRRFSIVEVGFKDRTGEETLTSRVAKP